MNIICDKQALIDAVGNVQRAVSGKSTLPALEGILLRPREAACSWPASISISGSPPPSTPTFASRVKSS